MKHPSNRAERRHERERIIHQRRFMRVSGRYPWPEQAWGLFSKWNGNCGSIRCHELKYFSGKRRRRQSLKRAGRDEIVEIELSRGSASPPAYSLTR